MRRAAREDRDPPHEQPWQLTRESREAILYLVFGLISLGLFDLFGLEETARLRIQDGVNQVFADFYPSKPSHVAPQGSKRKDVVLVLWDDDDLVHRGVSWPVPYAEHARVLDAIAKEKPAKVLVDVLFKDRRPSDDLTPLRAAIAGLRKTGSRVYLANGGGCTDDGMLPEVLTAPDPDHGGSEITVAESVPTPLREEVADGVLREYVLFADREALHTAERLRRECSTAALRMHLDTLPDRTEAQDLSAYWQPLVLFWGTCDEDATTWSLLRRLGGWLVGRSQRRNATCLPFRTVHVADLLADGAILPQLRDALVVYGTDFQAANDAVTTAIHDRRVSGPAVHAMALDNLQRWHDSYVHRQPISAFGSRELHLSWLDLCMLALGAGLMPRVRKALHRGRVKAWLVGFARGPSQLSAPRFFTAFVVTLFGSLLVPFLLSAVVGAAFFAIGGVAPVNFAAHVFVWIFVEQVLNSFDLLQRT